MLYFYCKVLTFEGIVILSLSGEQNLMRKFLNSAIGIKETFVSYNPDLEGKVS